MDRAQLILHKQTNFIQYSTVYYCTVLSLILNFIILSSKCQHSIQNTMVMCIYGQDVYDTLTMYSVHLQQNNNIGKNCGVLMK